ncbi:MAG: hypothetical protein AB7T49_01020 [Oligoflexales bacterium]
MFFRYRQLLAIFVLVVAQMAAAKPRRVFFGNCSFSKDPQKGGDWPAMCFRASAAGYGIRKSETLPLWQKFYHTDGYLGLHLNSSLSIHGSASQNITQDTKKHVEKKTDNLFIQMGNPALHRLRMTIGRFNNTFGINDEPFSEALSHLYKNPSFWETEKYSAKITIDDLATTQLDLGASTPFNDLDKYDSKTNTENFDLLARLIHDSSALGGTRFMASYLERPHLQRRLSLGIITVSPTDATASFEWVRVWDAYSSERFNQIMRFVYYDNMKNKQRWLFEYENELERHWMTTVGFDYHPFKYSYIRNSLSYYRSAIDKDLHHWIMTSGIGLYLL